MKVIFGNREIELKSTDIFVLDVDCAQSEPVITQDEFVAFLAAESLYNNDDTDAMAQWADEIGTKYSDLYDWEGGVYGAFLLRNGVRMASDGSAITKEGRFCMKLFEETIAA